MVTTMWGDSGSSHTEPCKSLRTKRFVPISIYEDFPFSLRLLLPAQRKMVLIGLKISTQSNTLFWNLGLKKACSEVIIQEGGEVKKKRWKAKQARVTAPRYFSPHGTDQRNRNRKRTNFWWYGSSVYGFDKIFVPTFKHIFISINVPGNKSRSGWSSKRWQQGKLKEKMTHIILWPH